MLNNFKKDLQESYRYYHRIPHQRIDFRKVKKLYVNNNVIKHFKFCEYNEDELLMFLEKNHLIRLYRQLKENNPDKDSCIETLGVFIYDEKQSNILIAPEKIKITAEKYDIPIELFQKFVEIHEYAHFVMSNKINKNIDKILALFIEESLATLIALYYVKSSNYYNQFISFVNNQPIQYRIALHRTDLKIEEIINFLFIWKNLKTEHSFFYIQNEKELLRFIFDKSFNKYNIDFII